MARGLEGLHVASETEVDVAAADSRWVVTRLRVPDGVAASGSHTVVLEITAMGDAAVQLREKTTFLVPR